MQKYGKNLYRDEVKKWKKKKRRVDGSFKKKPALQKSGGNRATKPHGAGRNGTDLFQREADLSGNRPAGFGLYAS